MKRNTILKWGLLGLVVVVTSAIGTVVLIKSVYKTPVEKQTNSPASIVKTISPADLIKKYSSEHKLAGYAPNTTASNSIINYKLSGSSYAVQINSPDNVSFIKADNSAQTDLDNAVKVSTDFLVGNNLKKVSERILTGSSEMTYEDTNTVCKLYSNLDSIKKDLTYGLVCVDKKTLIAERDSIEKLIDLYKNEGGVADFKAIVQTIHAEDNKQVGLLSITPEDATKASYMLIFASIDATWAYIGERTTPSVDVQDSFEISTKLKTAINNPKYNGLIARYIY